MNERGPDKRSPWMATYLSQLDPETVYDVLISHSGTDRKVIVRTNGLLFELCAIILCLSDHRCDPVARHICPAGRALERGQSIQKIPSCQGDVAGTVSRGSLRQS